MSHPPAPGQPNAPKGYSGTLIETDEDIRQALLTRLKGQTAEAPAHTTAVAPAAPPAPRPAERVASPYRPTARPPIAVLTVFDDGKTEGEVIRIRDTKFVIGRTEGDLRIPIDGRMSARHVDITCQTVGGAARWVVTDLQSTHGVFFRVSRTVLADKAEFLVGNGRYRLDAPQADPGATAAFAEAHSNETQAWVEGPGPFRPPALVELLGHEIGNRILLVKPEYWIGSDMSCPIARPDDPYCEPKHARVFRGPKGNWQAEHNKTLNGLWLRLPQIVVESMVQFQAGEQRFLLKVP
jgi:hypothetical protein